MNWSIYYRNRKLVSVRWRNVLFNQKLMINLLFWLEITLRQYKSVQFNNNLSRRKSKEQQLQHVLKQIRLLFMIICIVKARICWIIKRLLRSLLNQHLWFWHHRFIRMSVLMALLQKVINDIVKRLLHRFNRMTYVLRGVWWLMHGRARIVK